MKADQLINLNNQAKIKELDPLNCLSSIELMPRQLEYAWRETFKLPLENISQKYEKVFFCAMGGSAYAGRIIKSLFRLKVPFTVDVVDNYDLPLSADKKSLVIVASYTGNTEETLSCCRQALDKKLNIVGVTGGGQLADILIRNKLPVFIFDKDLNPSNQPRLGQGYMIASQLAILSALGLIKVKSDEISRAIELLAQNNITYGFGVVSESNPAKKIAGMIFDKIPVFVAGGFLEGAVHAVRNPINETGKHFADYFILPELNHHLLDGLIFPDNLSKKLTFVLINSSLYPAKIIKRLNITEDVINKNSLSAVSINLKGITELVQVFELLQIGNYLSFYLAVAHNVDPAPVPWVDYLKKKLKS